MANQPQNISHTRSYTRNEFTALRAYVQRVPATTIARLYFSEDEDGNLPTAAGVERQLREMQAALVALAIEHGSPVLAGHLKDSAKKHGSARLTAISLKMIEEVAQIAVAAPTPEHGVGMWFRPLVAQHLKGRNIHTLGQLVAFCNCHGGSWWRAVPRIGPLRAAHLVAWLRRHESTLGDRVLADVDRADPSRAADAEIIEVGGHGEQLAPLERMALTSPLSGAAGINRAQSFSYIGASHDTDAIRRYLYLHRDQPKTLRAYTKELERFLLWAVVVRNKPLSSILVDDCEAYKDFLKCPDHRFVGPRAKRDSRQWRPFATTSLSPESQKYAVTTLRAAFAWLVDVRYLAGNPWRAVKDPAVTAREEEIKVERALSSSLWRRLRAFVDERCAPPDGKYWRTVRVVLLLSGDSGLRREEICNADRAGMSESTYGSPGAPIWQLKFVGKGNKERTVPVSPSTIDALRSHWLDHGESFEAARAGRLVQPLLSRKRPRPERSMPTDSESATRPIQSTIW